MNRPLLALAWVLGLVAVPATASAQPACTDRADVVGHLAEKYSENTVALGVVTNGAVVEVLTGKNGATWSIIITRPDGTSCMVASGEGWETLAPIKLGSAI